MLPISDLFEAMHIHRHDQMAQSSAAVGSRCLKDVISRLLCQRPKDVRNDSMPRLYRRLFEIHLRPGPSFSQRLLGIPAQLAAAKCMWPEQVDQS